MFSEVKTNMFFKQLNDVLKKYEITIYSLADECDIERSFLSKLLKGKRKMSIEIFEKIIKVLPLEWNENLDLRKSFVYESLGEDSFNSFLGLIESKNLKVGDFEQNNVDISMKSENGIVPFNTRRDFLNISEAIICNSIKSDETKRFYTNIYSDECVSLYKKFFSCSDFDLRLLMNFNMDLGNVGSFISNNIMLVNSGFKINYLHNNSDFNEHLDILFPNYMIIGNSIVFVDYEFKSGYLVRDKYLADIYSDKFISRFETSNEYFSRNNNILGFKEKHLLHFKNKKLVFAIEDTVCAPMYMDQNMWTQIAREDIPNRNYLIDSTYEYYQNFSELSSDVILVLSKASIIDFTENGLVRSLPDEYIKPLSKENRLEIFKRIRDDFKDSGSFFVVNDALLSMNHLAIEIFSDGKSSSSSTLGYYNEDMPMHFIGNVSIEIFDHEAVKHLVNFIRHFIVSGYCYSFEDSIAILNEEIDKLTYMIEG